MVSVKLTGHLTSDNLLLKSIIGGGSQSMKADLELLLQNKPIIKTIEETIAFPDLHKIQTWSGVCSFIRVCNLYTAQN